MDWSPDGQWIYLSILKDQMIDIYRLHPDGTELTNITKGIEMKLGAKSPGKWVSDTGASHDGKSIIFLYTPKEGPGPFDFRKKCVIVTCGVDGANPRILTDGGNLAEGQYGVWSAGDYDPGATLFWAQQKLDTGHQGSDTRVMSQGHLIT